MTYDLIIIGAGASGLVAAIAAARCKSRVLVIEKKDTAGKKILATGNGKCNFTNLVQKPECYRSEDLTFAMKVLSSFDVLKTVSFFEELGILVKERNGYLYPNSEQASSIVKVLMMECRKLNVKFCYNEAVIDIKKPFYTVITAAASESISYYAKRLIIATGGCASPKLGSDGSGFSLARTLGHNIIKPLPALVQLRASDKYCKTISGVRTEAVVKLYADNRLLADEKGEVLFTDYGISGIPVLQISRFAAKALDKNCKVHLKLDLLPVLSAKELQARLYERIKLNPDRNTEEMLVGLLNHKLAYAIIREAGLDPYKLSGRLSGQELNLLAGNIKEFVMHIKATNSFEDAQVCSGGVDTAEIDAATMESRLHKGLYFAGEIVDVDGTCGGYNLQWAWSSGYLAGSSAGMKK